MTRRAFAEHAETFQGAAAGHRRKSCAMRKCAVLAAAILLACRPASAADRPNLLILLTDDQRWDAIGCAGNSIIQTPELDRLAEEGVLFTSAFVTSSICAASRASIFTGQFERAHGCNFNRRILQPEQLDRIYPVLLREAGYHTGFIGKYGVGWRDREIDGSELFDRWYGIYGQGVYFPETHPGKHLNQVMTDQVLEFLAQVPDNCPWCLSLSFKAPHSGKGYVGYQSELDLQDLYADVTIPMPPTAAQRHFDALPEFLRQSNARTSYWKQRFSTPELYQSTMRDYYRLITGTDRAIGRIRGALAQRGMDQNTVILFLSDNGDMMGDYLLGGKQLLYDVSIRVPMLALDPRVGPAAKGQRRSELVLNIDIAPTLLDLAGLPVPSFMQGRSLVPLIQGRPTAWREDFFCESNFCTPAQAYPMIEGVRTKRWKYIRYTDVTPVVEELFDLKEDPHETNSLAGSEDHSQVLSRLRLRCDELRTDAGKIR
jgi:arylsulfatase A-like enzyme